MAALSQFNRPTFHHNTTGAPPPELLPFHHDNSINPLLFESNNQFSSFNNGVITTKNNLPFHNPLKYPTLSSSFCNPLAPNVFDHGYCSNSFVTNGFDDHGFFQINPMEQMQSEPPLSVSSDIYHCGGSGVCSMEQFHQPELPSFPDTYLGNSSGFPQICSMEQLYPEPLPFSDIYNGSGYGTNQLQPELPPLKDIYSIGDSSEFGHRCYEIQGEERRISSQSMAARVRRRKISEKTSELGKLVPGGQKMTTAEMFKAAFKYIKFLQAQVGVLQLMPSSPELNGELQALVTCPSIQEKLYAVGKCIVTQTLAETLADDHQGTTN